MATERPSKLLHTQDTDQQLVETGLGQPDHHSGVLVRSRMIPVGPDRCPWRPRALRGA